MARSVLESKDGFELLFCASKPITIFFFAPYVIGYEHFFSNLVLVAYDL